MKREMICIICPMGCELTVCMDTMEVSGNGCPRGEHYAKSECINPVRTLTTTVKTKNGELVSVKTDRPIPKEKQAECMRRLNQIVAPEQVEIGTVIMENLFGCNVIATSNKE